MASQKNVLIIKKVRMKRYLLPIIITAISANAQQFINSGMIEYEVRVNNHRMFGDGFSVKCSRINAQFFNHLISFDI
jgi:hypothetical protein